MTVDPLTVQTNGVVLLNVTALPDKPPVALTVPVPPTSRLGGVPKTMAWLAGLTTWVTEPVEVVLLPSPL